MGGESRKDSHGEVEQLGRITQHWTSIRSYWGQAGYAFSAQAGKGRRKIRLHCCLRCRRPGSWHGPGKASRCHCLIPTVTLPPNSKPYYFPSPHQTTSTQNKVLFIFQFLEKKITLSSKNTRQKYTTYQNSPPAPGGFEVSRFLTTMQCSF